MEQKILHGDISINDLARALIGEFNRGNLRAQAIGDARQMIVQIATREMPASGGQTALSVTLRPVADGVSVEIGKQSWLGLAASLGQTAFYALRSPWNLLGRIDDIAQDIENIQLTDEVWRVLDQTARSLGASLDLSERLRRVVCPYCLTANPVGEPSCIACGAPLGLGQPRTCSNCGFVLKTSETTCPNCGKPV
jgi:predicted RNA-binding Zn-ribbon protein involved in translation (DUF1610 family)